MTSDIDVSKTNEFLRRRKLRLQQVREQSKDIAKKIRQRAKVEKLRHGVNIDAKKEKEYFECQEKLVKRLELLYSKSLQNVGASHKNALEDSQTDVVEKIDLSKLRGKEAVTELRKRKQEKLDEQKKILDRKLQARELANELSREKSSNVAKNLTKPLKKSDNTAKGIISSSDNINDVEKNQNSDSAINSDVKKADMGTQWEYAELPNEWEPNIPALSLPKDDTAKDITRLYEKSDKNKRLNLFALSDEMPSSLRGGLTGVIPETAHSKPSLTLVSEYLQNRNLKLREFEPVKKTTDDLQSIKQTILRTRASRADGSISDNICHVLDKQFIDVPSWQAEYMSGFGDPQHTHSYPLKYTSKYPTSNLHAVSTQKRYVHSKQTCKWSQNIKSDSGIEAVSGNNAKSARSTDPDITLTRKKSISIYNHNTRDVVDVPYDEEAFIAHNKQTNDDAYSQAFQETASMSNTEKEQLDKRQKEIRNKIAVTRQNVDKEYRDTLTFLNSLSKDKGNRPIRTAFMDEHKQHLEKDKHQRKMQLEFKKIERECHRQNCKHNKRKTVLQDNRRSKSPESAAQRRNFEYSWMPVPESDGSFAIHTIPTTAKKTGNTVKFSEPDTYHEYRSRHKHTPPTKDNEQRHKNTVETVLVQNSNESEENDDSAVSETSSVENLSLGKEKKVHSELRDAERIIIYKILDSRNKKKSHKFKANDNASVAGKEKTDDKYKSTMALNTGNIPNGSTDNLQEGIFKATSNKGDNISSMHFSENPKNIETINQSRQSQNLPQSYCCQNFDPNQPKDLQKESGDNTLSVKIPVCFNCGRKGNEESSSVRPSAASSSSSFKTAPNDKILPINPDNGFIKMVDDAGQETGKFYIGASGFVKDDNYEVVIQLRKKEGDKAIPEMKDQPNINLVENTEKSNVLVTQGNDESKIESDVDSKKEKTIFTVPTEIAVNAVTKDAVDTINNVDKQQKAASVDKTEYGVEETTSKANTCEKAVHTSFEDTYAIPAHLPKTDPLPKPATSTYTQTSFNHSSFQRPAFMHMSSSTSTAYMSPPELILPNFLRPDHILTHDELFESENTAYQPDSHDEQEEVYCQEYECRCKHCTCAVKVPRINIKRKKRNATSTPPNTAQSYNKDQPSPKVKGNEKRRCKCKKCSGHSQTKFCRKSHRKQMSTENTDSFRGQSGDIKTPKPVQFEQKISARPTNKKLDKNDNEINPVAKKYVNKLLSLNREGLKAIEIINQDCSIASTPGSSIINVPSNKDLGHTLNNVHNKISLEQIKNTLREQILTENNVQSQNNYNCKTTETRITECHAEKNHKNASRLHKKKSVHKVKSLNISRQLTKKKLESRRHISDSKNTTSTSSSTREDKRCRSSPTPRSYENSDYKNSTSSDIAQPISNRFKAIVKNFNTQNEERTTKSNANTKSYYNKDINSRIHRSTHKPSYIPSDSEDPNFVLKRLKAPQSPTNISTQTNGSIDVDTNFMKVAEDKLQNMEKIADLTEKCTKRLSNLAKVLEEVRKNKSLVYSQISTSDSASEAENKSDKNETAETYPVSQSYNLIDKKETQPHLSKLPMPENFSEKNIFVADSKKYTPILNDIPKPNSFLIPSNEVAPETEETAGSINTPENLVGKARGRPPPALSRINLKHGQEFCVTPHELSTVIEVDSPMSIKFKNQSSQQDTKLEFAEKPNQLTDIIHNKQGKTANPSVNTVKTRIDPDVLHTNTTVSQHPTKVVTDVSDNSKMHPMDMKQFNNIMLKPFISLQEYAKQCNIGLDEGSNIEDVMKDDPVNEELSSLHSDGSLPDVIAELLKRKMISEPFRFDSASNVNSTTLSSESTLSILALSKSRKHKRKTGVLKTNKENIGETSETLSLSSNPDLENAFQKLGMGWASSTLKKTKERLALSSSSNTSSSSMAQFKIRTFSQDVPTLVTDSTSSLLDLSNKREKKLSPDCNIVDNCKNAVQQTSLMNSLTVKDFLTNELAKKITFSNKTRNETDEQFMSLYETNIPDNMKNSSVDKDVEDDQSVSSAKQNRARTSTPVQLYKSTAYHSTSSSNASNGLFSNADDMSSVKVTSTSIRNHSTSDKDDLTIPNYSLKIRKDFSDFSKSD